jgi:hypothetical protein
MSNLPLDDLDRTRLDWPEPVLIDLICDSYGTGPSLSERVIAARLQVLFLRELVEGDLRQAAFRRLELIAACTSRNIGLDAIETADTVAFAELIRIVETRFRNSPKLRQRSLLRLYEARDRLPTRAEPRQQSASVRTLPVGRVAMIRPLTPSARKQTVVS